MAELRGDLTKDQIKRLERKVQDGEQRNRDLLTQSEQATKVMNELEEVFRQLQQVRLHSPTSPAQIAYTLLPLASVTYIRVCACGQVTGVNTFEEMIQKFSAQRSNTQALHEEKRQVRRSLHTLLVGSYMEQAMSAFVLVCVVVSWCGA